MVSVGVEEGGGGNGKEKGMEKEEKGGEGSAVGEG